jgi:hypothetical protein
MNLNWRLKTLLVVLVAAIIWAISEYSSDPSRPATGLPPAPPTVATAGMTAGPARPVIDTAAAARRPWGENPFRLKPVTAAAQAKTPMWTLDGVVYHPSAPSAIINRQAVSIGDTVAGATVEKISRRGVDLKYRGKRIHLELSRGRP